MLGDRRYTDAATARAFAGLEFHCRTVNDPAVVASVVAPRRKEGPLSVERLY